MRFGKAAVLLIASSVLLEPLKSHAQTAEPIVIVCAWSPQSQSVVTLDLAGEDGQRRSPAGKPRRDQSRGFRETSLQITAQQIDWVERNNTFMYSLNRFTLNLHLAATTGGSSDASCRKQEKQV